MPFGAISHVVVAQNNEVNYAVRVFGPYSHDQAVGLCDLMAADHLDWSFSVRPCWSSTETERALVL